jgi:hypothetical protein
MVSEKKGPIIREYRLYHPPTKCYPFPAWDRLECVCIYAYMHKHANKYASHALGHAHTHAHTIFTYMHACIHARMHTCRHKRISN